MEPISAELKARKQPGKSRYLHSPNHLLAEELASRLGDKKHFGFYLKMAMTHEHSFLRKLAGEVLESPAAKNPAKLFAFLIKKSHEGKQ